MFRRKRPVGEGDYEAMVERLEERLSFGSPWDRVSAGHWQAVLEEPLAGWEQTRSYFAHGRTYEPERVSVELEVSVDLSDSPGARVEATLDELVVPRELLAEAAVFCVAANRLFRYWNLYVVASEDGCRVVSAATVGMHDSTLMVPVPLLETLVLRAVRAGVIATPAVQALVSGVAPEDAVSIADSFDDAVSPNEQPNWEAEVDDSRLIDDAQAAMKNLTVAEVTRRTPTQLFFGSPLANGGFVASYVDAIDGNLLATCYPLGPIPAERLQPVALAMNLIAATGVAFTLALDLEGGLVRFKNGFSFRGVRDKRKAVLEGVIDQVVSAPLLYTRLLNQVAFEGVDPAEALTETERLFKDFRDSPEALLRALNDDAMPEDA